MLPRGATNGSLIWHEQTQSWLVLFRFLPVFSFGRTQICAARYDRNWNCVQLPHALHEIPHAAQDPRVFEFRGRQWMVHAEWRFYDGVGHVQDHMLVEIYVNNEGYVVPSMKTRRTLWIEGDSDQTKNWVPFVHNNQLYFTRHLVPHEVLLCTVSGRCEKVHDTRISTAFWKHGHICCGTPALPYRDGYIAMFHGANYTTNFHALGGILFDKQPPFRILKCSSEPIQHDDLYTTENKVSKREVCSPCGMHIDGDTALVSYGCNDTAVRVMQVDLAALYASLIDVKAAAPDEPLDRAPKQIQPLRKE